MARYVTGYVTTTIGPLQETSSFRDFADWTQSKEQYSQNDLPAHLKIGIRVVECRISAWAKEIKAL